MATIQLNITVGKIADVIALFDKIKVFRSTTGVGGPFVELTIPATRIDLVAGQSLYQFTDTAGDAAFFYKTSYFNSTSSLESSLSEAIQGDTDPLYITVADVRAEGVLVSSASDSKVLMLIKTWQDWIDKMTRQFFVVKNMTLDVDGNGTKLLQIPIPIVSITSLFINEDFVNAVSTNDFAAYTGRGGTERDDRKNPRIKLLSDRNSIFVGTGPVGFSTAVFETGEKNHRIVGSFGYVDPDGCTPEAIRYALLKLVVRNSKPLAGAYSAPGGPIVEEETDRHRRKYSDGAAGSKGWSFSGDPEVDQIIAVYRGPMKMGAPRTMHGRLTGGRVLV